MGKCCLLCGNKANKDQNISLHRFPSKLNEHVLHMRWVEACGLSQEDNVPNVFVCSMHFKAEDLSSTNMRIRLKPDSVPSVCLAHPLLEMQCTNKENVSGAYNFHDSERHLSHESSIQEPPSFLTSSTIKVEEDIANEQENSNESIQSPATSDARESPEIGEPTASSYRMFSVPGYVSEMMISDVAAPRRAGEVISFAKKDNYNKMIEVKRLQTTNRRLSRSILYLRKKVQELDSQEADQVECGPESNGSEVYGSDEDILYDLGKAESDLKSLGVSGMPSNWLIAINTSGINFLYVDDANASTGPVSRSILLLPDMTLEVRVMGKFVQSLKFGRIKCLASMLAVMENVAALRKCIGFDGVCQGEGFIPDDLGMSDKCKACRRERKRFTDRQNYERKASVVDKKLQKARDWKNLKRKFERLQKSMEKAKEEIENLKRQCAKASETAVNDAIRNLEKSEQQAVKVCLAAKKGKFRGVK